MTHLTNTAFGLDSLPDENWRHFARCLNRWDEWTEFIRIEPDDLAVKRAAHQCRHCPVFADCLKWTEARPPEQGIIQAARYRSHYGQLVQIDDSQVQCIDCLPLTARDARERKRAADRRRWHRQQAQRRELATAGAR